MNLMLPLIIPTVSVSKSIAESTIAKAAVDPSPATNMPNSGSRMTIPESTSDFKDWLEGIKMVARLPGGMPIEFRRKVRKSPEKQLRTNCDLSSAPPCSYGLR